MITFDALCSAMNEALPQGIGLFAATYCRNFVFESTPQFAVFEIVDTCSVFARTVMMQAPRISFTGTSSSTSLVVGLNSTEEGRQTSCSRPLLLWPSSPLLLWPSPPLLPLLQPCCCANMPISYCFHLRHPNQHPRNFCRSSS